MTYAEQIWMGEAEHVARRTYRVDLTAVTTAGDRAWMLGYFDAGFAPAVAMAALLDMVEVEMHTYRNELFSDDDRSLGTFSSHWAACAAMIRLSDPTFKSLGGDQPDDLAKEMEIQKRESR